MNLQGSESYPGGGQIQHRELDPARGRGKYPGGRAKVSQSECEHPLFPAFLEPVTVTFYIQSRAVVQDPVQDRRSDHMISEDFSPLAV